MSPKISKDLSIHRLEQAKENIEEAEILFKMNKFKGANNRAYYSIFHSIKAVLALEPIDFKRVSNFGWEIYWRKVIKTKGKNDRFTFTY
mgnify:CR=1 FL=1